MIVLSPVTAMKCIKFWEGFLQHDRDIREVEAWVLDGAPICIRCTPNSPWIELDNLGGEGQIYARVPEDKFSRGIQEVFVATGKRITSVWADVSTGIYSVTNTMELVIKINHFVLPRLQAKISQAIAREMARRKIDPRDFLRASWLVPEIATGHREALAADNLSVDLRRLRQSDSDAIQSGRDACQTLNAYLEAEVAHDADLYVGLTLNETHSLVCDGKEPAKAVALDKETEKGIADRLNKGEKVRDFAGELGLTQKVIAQTQPCVDQLRKFNAQAKTLEECATVLGVSRRVLGDIAFAHSIEFRLRGRNLRKSPT